MYPLTFTMEASPYNREIVNKYGYYIILLKQIILGYILFAINYSLRSTVFILYCCDLILNIFLLGFCNMLIIF